MAGKEGNRSMAAQEKRSKLRSTIPPTANGPVGLARAPSSSSPLTFSVITVCLNSEAYLADAIDSVLSQRYPHLEHIIVDGGSTDRTVAIVQSYGSRIAQFVSEPDEGIYDAMNKGIGMASGDVVAILNSDDFYDGPEVIEAVAEVLKANHTLDGLYGDVLVVDRDHPERITRRYVAADFGVESLARGIMPGHGTLFLRRELMTMYGGYRTDYRIAADFELLVRLWYLHRIDLGYLPRTILRARSGGISDRNLLSKYHISQEVRRACRENGLPTNFFRVYSRLPLKLKQWLVARWER
jgi:glycosyltransferase involved in cell wall biosynthesis